MPDSTPPESVAFELKLASTALPPNDPRWRPQVEGLLADLKRNGGEVRRESTPVDGTKGGLDTIILALGSSGAIAGAVAVFNAWLARSGDRVATFTREVDGKKETITIDAKNVSEATFRQFFKGALK